MLGELVESERNYVNDIRTVVEVSDLYVTHCYCHPTCVGKLEKLKV